MRLSSPRRFFYSFFMLHNPRVSPCTQYCRSVHLCDLSPRYTKYSYPKLNTINLHSLVWGVQYQPSISKLPSSGLLNLEKFNIMLTLFHLNEWATSDHRMLLTRWSTQHLVPTRDLRNPYHFPWIKFLTFSALVQSAELFETVDLSLPSSKPPDFLSD